MTTADFICYLVGLQSRKIEAWQRTRKLAYTSAASMGGLECSELEFMPLPLDPIEEVKRMSLEELNQII